MWSLVGVCGFLLHPYSSVINSTWDTNPIHPRCPFNPLFTKVVVEEVIIHVSSHLYNWFISEQILMNKISLSWVEANNSPFWLWRYFARFLGIIGLTISLLYTCMYIYTLCSYHIGVCCMVTTVYMYASIYNVLCGQTDLLGQLWECDSIQIR